MSKSNGKKYNPRKNIAARTAGAEGLAGFLSRHVPDAMDDWQIAIQSTRMLGAAHALRPGSFDMVCVRQMSHFYRICLFLGRYMKNQALWDAALAGQKAIMHVIDQPVDIPTVSPEDHRAMYRMVMAVVKLIEAKQVSKTTWRIAMEYTHSEFTEAIQGQFDEMRPELRQQAIEVIHGRKVPEAAEAIGVDEKVMVGAAIEIAMIAHAIADDSLIPLPDKISVMRKIAGDILVPLQGLIEGKWREQQRAA
jgi:hypothetical protein